MLPSLSPFTEVRDAALRLSETERLTLASDLIDSVLAAAKQDDEAEPPAWHAAIVEERRAAWRSGKEPLVEWRPRE